MFPEEVVIEERFILNSVSVSTTSTEPVIGIVRVNNAWYYTDNGLATVVRSSFHPDAVFLFYVKFGGV